MKRLTILSVLILITFTLLKGSSYIPQTSKAGFFELGDSPRKVYDFNVGWRFLRGDIEGAERIDFDDSSWSVVVTPHTVQLMPAEASGSRNYQGKAWYRKHFTIDKNFKDKLINVYFEAVMGKSDVYVNGTKVLTHYGGYLPFSVELTALGLNPGDECVIAVMTDNSDDRNYPPGKKQATLDFAYHGGIYRDVWMVVTNRIHITDANKANKVKGGGVLVQYGEISKAKAEVQVSVDVDNKSLIGQRLLVLHKLVDKSGTTISEVKQNLILSGGKSSQQTQKILVKNPDLWHPDSPNLYWLETRIADASGRIIDGVKTRIGIRKVEFRGSEGLWINGELSDKLIGGNRHQDFAYVGNAVPNSQHWYDAKKLREAGCRLIRVAHYPQDPSFMDACDELGLFVIVAIPGWQFWNKDPQFAEFAYDDIRNMIRRDRNHASVFMWEPILNETRFPLEFALKAQSIVREEYPGAVSVADGHSDGVADNYEVVYGWPEEVGKYKQCILTREFGENVDDWYAHNNNNRASRSWGERALLGQALQLAKAYNAMYPESKQFIGGALWHPFDHQRGYHPDPYWGGLLDAFRQPKYSYYMFKSQMSPKVSIPNIDAGPMIFIAHEIGPYSEADVTVFTNCDEVRLIAYETDTMVQKVERAKFGMPNPPVVFKDVFQFERMRQYTYFEKNWQKVSLVVEGLIDGKVVCREKKMPSRRSTKLRLRLDDEGRRLVANSSDFIPIICEVTDDSGNVRRLAKEQILFSIEGEGEIIGDDMIGANPRAVEFGSAPLLVRSTLKAGKIRVKARVLFEGEHAPTPAEIEFESVPSDLELVYRDEPSVNRSENYGVSFRRTLSEEDKKRALDEVETQQTEFGIKK